MSQLNITSIKNKRGDFGPTLVGLSTVSGNLNVTGTISGDGSGLTGIANTANIKSDTISVTGVVTATTFDGNLSGNVTGNLTGNVTGNLTGDVTGDTIGNLTGDVSGNITGVAATFTGDVTVGGTLTYQDVTNIDSVGVVTARTGVRVLAGGVDIGGGGLSVTGVSTFNNNLDLQDNDKILLGTGDDLEIYHNGSASFIHDNGTGDLNLCFESGSKLVIQSGTGGNHIAEFKYEGAAELYNNGNKKLETTSSGVTVTGNLIPDGDSTRDLGASGTRWANVYTGDLNLSNEGSSNDVDGTWGKYTIQEGEDDLFLINKRTGKTYKFVLQEVN
jgi:hypothetical protein